MPQKFVSMPVSPVYGVLSVTVTDAAIEFKGEIRGAPVDLVVSDRSDLGSIFEASVTALKQDLYEPIVLTPATPGYTLLVEQHRDDDEGALDYHSARLSLEIGVEVEQLGSCHIFFDPKASVDFIKAMVPLVQ